MKKKTLAGIILFLSLINISQAQNIKSETVELTKTIQPKLFKTESPVDITLVRTTSAVQLQSNSLFSTYVQIPDYITNNTSTPKYVAVLNYIYKPISSKNAKMGALLNQLYAKSNTSAVLYLLTREKGVFYQENIELTDNSDDNWKSNTLGFSTVLKATVSEANLSKYLTNGQFNLNIISEIEKTQIERLTVKAYQAIRDDMSEHNAKNKLRFNYLQKEDNFNSSEFDKAYAILKNNINPINKKEIQNTIEIWTNEANKITDISNKSTKKYKIALLENILISYYIIDDYNSDNFSSQLKTIDEKNYIYYFYANQKKNFIANNTPITEFNYVTLPESVAIPDANKNLFTTNNSSSTNEASAKINKLNFPINYDYGLNLNNLKYQLSILRDEKGLQLKYQNSLMDEILWYIMNIKFNTKSLPSKAKNQIETFSAFGEKLNAEFESKNLYKFGDEKNYKLMKAREYFSSNYKLDDFFQHISSMDLAVNSFFESKNSILSNAFKDAVEINSITQLRKFVSDHYYENQRKEKEAELDKYVESKSSIPAFKNEVYFEFKNTIDVLNNKKLLSADEYQNYQLLINLLLFKLNMYK